MEGHRLCHAEDNPYK
jgi:hypothetical protein